MRAPMLRRVMFAGAQHLAAIASLRNPADYNAASWRKFSLTKAASK